MRPIPTVFVASVAVMLAVVAGVAGGAATEQLSDDDVVAVERILPDVMGPARLREFRGDLFVLSSRDHAVLHHDRDLKLVRRIGRIGNGPGELYRPADFDVAPDGTIWVADLGNNRIVSFDQNGDHRAAFSSKLPIGVTALDDGKIAVVRRFADSWLTIHDSDGRVIREVGTLMPIEGATEPAQRQFHNRPVVEHLPSGDLLTAFRFAIPPLIKVIRPDGGTVRDIRPPEGHFSDIVTVALEERRSRFGQGSSGGKVIINDVAVEPGTGDLWIARGGPGLIRLGQKDDEVRRVAVRDAAGNDLGLHDLEFETESRFVAISAGRCFRGVVPR